MEPKWLQNGSLEASGRPLGGHPAAKSIFERFRAPFWLHFGSDFGSPKSPKMNIFLSRILGAIFMINFGLLEASGVDFG